MFNETRYSPESEPQEVAREILARLQEKEINFDDAVALANEFNQSREFPPLPEGRIDAIQHIGETIVLKDYPKTYHVKVGLYSKGISISKDQERELG